ncbi:ABC transporter permease [Bacillus pseudomycoides]|uniref:ABC transporter permease n=1 Tax=Bacillus pseudomycoides TaxID=64104 RepID=UPI000BF09F8B|nr:ABC transporter permease [Bacillus pseudomycoides]PEK32218.1 ABC transporter permease [Bacillus pseudomycoides]PEK63115.1 ABC transporter permease [Bacillus pseudomycoides]PEP43068.1 ABC transporter permease [Bacillus pseudomycoides]PEP45236.1 ABC transporter permease [Bacillus pseudomycoides]PFX48950.1 ABC transporter permease [Bacillus pseudomycoides]
MKRVTELLPALILSSILLIAWEVGARIVDEMYILPSPTAILAKMWALRDILLTVHLPATLYVVLIGVVISIVLGVGLAMSMNASKWIERAFYPLLVASQTIPITALAPLFVLWFGYSIWSKVVVTVLITFFPIAVNTYDGLCSTKKEWEELLVTYGATKKDIFLKLKLPSALPYFFSALKIAVPLSVIGAAIGEWLGAQAGLGYFSKRMMTQLDGAGVFAPIVLLSLLAILFVLFVSILEKKFISWRKHS